MKEIKKNILKRKSVSRKSVEIKSDLFIDFNIHNKSNILSLTLFISKEDYGIDYTEPKDPKQLKNILGRNDIYKYIFKLLNSTTTLEKNEVARKVESCEVSQSISTYNLGIFIEIDKDTLKKQ